MRTVGVQRGCLVVSTRRSTRFVSTSSSCSRLKWAIGKVPVSLNIASEFTRSRRLGEEAWVGLGVGLGLGVRG